MKRWIRLLFFHKVGSVTYAMKAKSILQQYGMRARVIKTVSEKKNEGCGYSVSVETEYPSKMLGSYYGEKALRSAK